MLLLPVLMPREKERFDLLFVLARRQFFVSKAAGQVDRSVVVGMLAVMTDDTPEASLVRPVRSIRIVAMGAFLRGVGCLHAMRRHAALGRRPNELLWDMPKLRCRQVGVHRPRFETHGDNRKILVNDVGLRMRCKHLIDRAIDRLLHMTAQTLAAGAAGRRNLGASLLFEAGPQFRLPTPFLSIALLPLPQFAMNTPIVLTSRGGEEIGHADVHPNNGRCWIHPKRNVLIEAEGEPPEALAPDEQSGGIEGFAFKGLAMIWSEFDRNAQRVPFVQGRDT